jgi:Ca2+-binding EF-hand superfamily protein
LSELNHWFQAVDTDHSGDLTVEEFITALRQLKLEITDLDSRRLFNAFDRNGNGRVSYREFLYSLQEPMPEHRYRLVENAFKTIDQGMSGKVEIN